MKKWLVLVVFIIIVIGVTIISLKSININKDKMMEVKILANELKLEELKGVRVNLGEIFDKKYTCDGENINPEIILPDNGVYAVLLEDPDAPAGTWFHWGLIIWSTTKIPEGLEKTQVGENYYQTYNDFYYYNYIVGNIKGIGYDGPCPPKGHGYHRYYFEIFKLKKKPEKPIKDKEELKEFVKENAVAVYIYVSKYKR